MNRIQLESVVSTVSKQDALWMKTLASIRYLLS